MRTFLAVSLLLSACTDDRNVGRPEDPIQNRAESFDIPQFTPRALDVLFVIDSSPAMAVHEAHLAANLPVFADVLEMSSGDLHVGVITSDLGGAGCGAGDGGALRGDGLVGSPFAIRWKHLDESLSKNYEGDLRDELTQLTAVGHAGCADARPLDAIRVALEPSTNPGFRRSDASLAIFVIAATDDRSEASVDDSIRYIRELSDHASVVVSGIYDAGAPRLDAFFSGVPQGDRTWIRDEDLLDATSQVRWLHDGWWGEPCLEGALADVDPTVAGTQYDCAITDVVIDSASRDVTDGFARTLPACSPGSLETPCWRFEVDRQNCPAGGLRLVVDRQDWPARGTHVIGSCVTEAKPW